MTGIRQRLADALVQAAMEGDDSAKVTVSMRVLEIMAATASLALLEPMAPPTDGSTFGDRLRSARNRMKLKVEVVADTLGFSSSTVRAHENGQNGAPADKVARYAQIYRVTPEWLLYGRQPDALFTSPTTKS